MGSKIFKNKTAKGLVSMITIIILLSSILAVSIFYESSITAQVIKETSIEDKPTTIKITEVNDIKELNHLNEGWYEIRSGFVFYLETFNSYVPLYIKVLNPKQQNGLLAVDDEGDLRFETRIEYAKNEIPAEKIEEKSVATTMTGKVTGMERVSGFATCPSIINSNYNMVWYKTSGCKYSFLDTRGTISADYDSTKKQLIIEGGTKDYQQGGTLYPWAIPKEVYTDTGKQTQTQLRPPVFDINNPTKFKTEMDTYIEKTIQTAAAKKEEQIAKPLIDAANNWAKNPNDPKSKEKFDLESKKWQIYQETKNYPALLVGYLDSSDNTAQLIAKDLVVKRINEPGVKDALLESAASDLNNQKAFELNRLVQLQDKLSPLGARVDFSTGQIVDSRGYKGWGLKADGTIDPNIKAPEVVKIQETKIKEVLQKAYQQYSQQGSSEQLTPKEGKFYDNLGREVTLSFSSQTGNWEITNRQSPQTIKTQQGTTLTKTEFLSEIGGQSVSVYKDATGKLYSYTGNELTEGQVKQASKFGTIDTQIVYSVVSGQVDKEKPVSAKIGNVQVPAQTYAELLGFLKAAGSSPKTDGSFTKGSPLVIKNEKGDSVAIAYGFINEEGIAKGTTIQSNFKNGQPLLIKTTSEDGGVTIKEEKEFKEFIKRDNQGNVIKDASGKETKEQVLQTKSWVKIAQIGRAERYYKTDEKGKQTGDYTEITTDSLTGEPFSITLKINGNEQIAYYDSESKTITGYQSGTDNEKAISQLTTLRNQFASQQFFATIERIFTEFQGLGYYATLFFDEDSLLEWRENVDKAFATLYLGTEYWSSAICSQYLDGENEGIAYAETPQGLAQVAAHIEATRSEQITTPTGREFNYKITFNVRNGDFEKDLRAPEEMRINVILKGERTAAVFKQAQTIKRGSSFGRVGRNAIAQDSTIFYNQVCLKFDKIPLKWKIDDKELCNTIQESAGTPTSVGAATTTTSGGGGTGDINDF